jgi:8-oxo-dGTP diphosphatase
LYACWEWSGKPVAAEGQDFDWVDADELGKRPMPPADEPLIAAVRALL